MINLAGHPEANVYARAELRAAGVPIFHSDAKGEVPSRIEGRLNGFRFHRAWYYWVVVGDVPLGTARLLYSSAVGKKDVRVAGHCGCPPPEEWAFPHHEDLVREGVQDPERIAYGELAEMCNSGQIKARRFVSSYHIDSQAGLNLFVDMIRNLENS